MEKLTEASFSDLQQRMEGGESHLSSICFPTNNIHVLHKTSLSYFALKLE